jgi:hypothetical protein
MPSAAKFRTDDTDPATNIEELFILQGTAPELLQH